MDLSQVETPPDASPVAAPQTSDLPDRVGDTRDFERALASLTGIERSLSEPVRAAVSDVVLSLGPAQHDPTEVAARFYGRINQKLMSHRAVLSEIYGVAAGHGLTFNYPAKKEIAWCVDSGDLTGFQEAVAHHGADGTLTAKLTNRFQPLSHEATRTALVAETQKPTKLRKAHERDVLLDVFEAAVGPLLWSLWPAMQLQRYFAARSVVSTPCTVDFLADLHQTSPDLFDRDRALVVRAVEPSATQYEPLRARLASWIADEYERMSNYGFLAIVIRTTSHPAHAWELCSDLTLMAERFDEYPLDKGFFQSSVVAEQTMAYAPEIDAQRARFDHISEGFSYRDTFVVHRPEGDVQHLLLIFQKNTRDETVVPCPACRSDNVAGNSYPSLGVKSWECRNRLCPDRSIYNRGKRYSFKSLINQAAIEHPENAVPIEMIRRWQRDVVESATTAQILDMLVRMYSISNDGVVLFDYPDSLGDPLGRKITRIDDENTQPGGRDFWRDAAFFERYAVAPLPSRARPQGSTEFDAAWTVLEGDAFDVLAGIADETFDGAVTSPPYFNAREYAQWPNLYTYLYDMQRINGQVFRTLRCGAVYSYNIFDYFDNERTVVFSAMGKKRLSLGALMVDLFRRIGFDLAGVAVWDKGEIQGKRGFNAGNRSPFYQAPFNCWEHVLLLRKPSPNLAADPPAAANQVLPIHPVVKIVRGKNRHGHTAPFPVELPEAVLSDLAPDSLVLDPFAGSGTTGRAAMNLGQRSVLLERDTEYVALARRLLRDHETKMGAAPQMLW